MLVGSSGQISSASKARKALARDELQRRVGSIAGVSGVTYADSRPPNDVNNHNNFDLEDFPAAAGQSQPDALLRVHGCRLARRDAEKLWIECCCARQESANIMDRLESIPMRPVEQFR